MSLNVFLFLFVFFMNPNFWYGLNNDVVLIKKTLANNTLILENSNVSLQSLESRIENLENQLNNLTVSITKLNSLICSDPNYQNNTNMILQNNSNQNIKMEISHK